MFSLRSVIYTALGDLKGVFKGDLKGVNFLLVALKGIPFRVHPRIPRGDSARYIDVAIARNHPLVSENVQGDSFLVLSCNVNCRIFRLFSLLKCKPDFFHLHF